MKIVIISATDFELATAKEKIKSNKNIEILFEITGIGMLATAIHLSKIIYEQKPDFIIQAGIAGSFTKEIILGDVFLIEKEFIGDVGVYEKNNWEDIFDLKLMKPNEKPFSKKSIVNKTISSYNQLNLPIVNAVTVNQITTQSLHIHQLQKKYNPSIESMEGAALHYACNFHKIPYLQIRSISNYVGERDKSKWKLKLAINNLNKTVVSIIRKSF